MPTPEEIDREVRDDDDEEEEESEEEAAAAAKAKAAEERMKRLQNLRSRVNQARNLNTEAANDEYRRKTEGEAAVEKREKKESWEARKRKSESDAAEGIVDERNDDLAVTASAAQDMRKKKRRKDGQAAGFGWDMFNVDTQVKTFKKRVKQVHESFGDDLQQQYAADTEKMALDPSRREDLENRVVDQPTAEMRMRMQKELAVTSARRGQFSRRRAHNDEGHVDYINDRNQKFNEKLKRSFDNYTTEIRQNLERGTAL
eukprot:TRINITY_DN18206_c0_g1_i1.p1 TRINITY_DN18206_c0_g1~~TRINITY_DN18206_c0_g1_i1.p1  ORF type:complete len:269 (+),score=123.89 TRINITY_DN18206_c0_g1_i1:35-808(+)